MYSVVLLTSAHCLYNWLAAKQTLNTIFIFRLFL